MVNFNSLALAATTLFGLTAAAPAATAARDTATYVPGTLNNTREFYIKMETIAGSTKYNGYTMEAYHTGAGTYSTHPIFRSSPLSVLPQSSITHTSLASLIRYLTDLDISPRLRRPSLHLLNQHRRTRLPQLHALAIRHHRVPVRCQWR